jgi:hypothetical protein
MTSIRYERGTNTRYPTADFRKPQTDAEAIAEYEDDTDEAIRDAVSAMRAFRNDGGLPDPPAFDGGWVL